ncbi:transmembrane 220 family protein [Glaciecola siphonariae]|uniref:Transmembrane 220 family protein n=1 Tax=Glaciecola siphonariae TaxID=521012 RepID=A0ABV9M1H6_9ALTE
MSAFHLFHACGVILFTVFAYLQFNDASQYSNHDAWVWIALYGTAAFLNLLSLLTTVSKNVHYLWLGFTAGALLFRMQDDRGNLHLDWIDPSRYWNEAGNQMVQQTNESGGLVILLIWALVQLIIVSNRQSKLPPYSY